MGFLKKLMIKNKLKKGQLITVDEVADQQLRDELLVSYAVDNNIPIVVGEQKRWSELRKASTDIVILRLAQGFTFEVKNAVLNNGLLIDESVDMEMVRWLLDMQMSDKLVVRGGFIQ